MIKMMKFSIKLVLLICLTVTHAQYCTSKRGCTVQELSDELVHRDDENLYQVLSWDIRNEKVSVICDVVRNIEDIMVINFQQVSRDQLETLMSSCLKGFNSTHAPTSMNQHEMYNPVLYLNDNTVLKEIKSGTTNPSNEKCKSLTWVQLSLHVTKPASYRRRPRLSKRSLASNLFAILSGRKTFRKIRQRSPRHFYLKKVLFVNSNIVRDAYAQTNTYYCLRHVYFSVMGRRRSRALYSGNVGSIRTVLDYPRRRSLFSDCEPTGQSSPNKICIANRGRRDTFQYRLTTTLKTNSKRSPTFVAFTM